MTARQTVWPRTWLMTDERLGARLWEAIDRLPKDSGVVFRHYALASAERLDFAAEVASTCRTRGFSLAVAGDIDMARAVGANLIHNPPDVPADIPFSRAVHSLHEAEAAARVGASFVFVSPVFATRSHPGATELGPGLAKRIAEAAGAPAIALGGMNARRFAELEGFYGWAGIDAWLGEDDI
jgi:thiamine-phosphate pyrophosphorylase